MSGGSGTGGANDNSSLSSAGGGGTFPSDVFTSTPKFDINRTPSSSSVIPVHSTAAFEISNTNNSTPSSSSFRPSGDSGIGGQYLSHKRLSGGDDWRSSSQESSPYASTSRMNIYAAPASSSSPRDPGAVASSSSSMPNSYTAPSLSSNLHNHNHYPPQVQAGNLNVNNSNKNNSNFDRELPPAPTDPPPPIPAAERLDRLTMLSSSRDHPVHSHMSNHQSWSRNNREEEVVMRRTGPVDLGRRTSQGPLDRHHPNNNSSSSSSSGLLPDQLQPPVPRSQPPLNITQAASKQQKNEDNSVVSGHNPRRPPANLMPGQNNNHHLFHRARPASAMGPSPHIRGVISRPPGEGRPRQQQQNQQQSQQSGGYSNDRPGRGPLSSIPAQNSSIHHNQSQPERPKSVPPHMFIPSSMEETNQSHQFHPKETPIPPPRRTKDDHDGLSRGNVREAPEGHEPPRESRSSSVSLLREPSRSSSRGPTSASSTDSHSIQSLSQVHSNSNNQQQVSASYPQHHQQRFSSQNMDMNRINVAGRPSSQSFSDQHQTSSNISHGQFNSSTNPSSRPVNPRQFKSGQQPLAGLRPDSLSLAGSRGKGQGQPHPRSQSSIGQPMNILPPGAGPYGRSTTPGPQPAARRDSAPLQQTQHLGDVQERQMPDLGQRLPPSGAPPTRSGQTYSMQGRQDSGTADYSSVGSNRQNRVGSLPKEVGHGDSMRPDSRSYPQPHPASFSGSQHYPERPSSQKQQQQQRSQSGPGLGPTPSTNGPFIGHNNTEFQQHSSPSVSSGQHPHPRQAQVPPQIRSQGRPLSNSHLNTPPPPPTSSSNRQVGSPASSLSSPLSEKAEQNVGGLAISNKGAPSIAPTVEEQAEDKGQAKSTNSIWYEYGCV